MWTACSKYTPKVLYGGSFNATRAARSSQLAPDMPTLLLTSSWEQCDRTGDHTLYRRSLGQQFERVLSLVKDSSVLLR